MRRKLVGTKEGEFQEMSAFVREEKNLCVIGPESFRKRRKLGPRNCAKDGKGGRSA